MTTVKCGVVLQRWLLLSSLHTLLTSPAVQVCTKREVTPLKEGTGRDPGEVETGIIGNMLINTSLIRTRLITCLFNYTSEEFRPLLV